MRFCTCSLELLELFRATFCRVDGKDERLRAMAVVANALQHGCSPTANCILLLHPLSIFLQYCEKPSSDCYLYGCVNRYDQCISMPWLAMQRDVGWYDAMLLPSWVTRWSDCVPSCSEEASLCLCTSQRWWTPQRLCLSKSTCNRLFLGLDPTFQWPHLMDV
jgi:hypothetical protein